MVPKDADGDFRENSAHQLKENPRRSKLGCSTLAAAPNDFPPSVVLRIVPNWTDDCSHYFASVKRDPLREFSLLFRLFAGTQLFPAICFCSENYTSAAPQLFRY